MRFRDQPIARKALTLGMVPTVCALAIVGTAFALSVFVTLRGNLMRDSEALVAIVADNMSAAVSFNDPATAAELLRAFRAQDSINRVCVFDAAGRLFAAYDAHGPTCASSDLDSGVSNTAAWMFVHPVAARGRRVGSVQLVTNVEPLYARLRAMSLTALATLAVGALLAWVLADRMQRSISHPIISLAHVADQVSRTRDYSLRAEKTTADEVGQLVEAFNGMLAQVQRQDRVKDEFLATLSHELRTPLNAILGWLQILQRTEPDERMLERALASVERNARSQQRVVEDLLDISRIVTGKLQMSNAVVDVRSVVTAAVETVSADAAAKDIALRITAPPTPCLVAGDAGRLQQAAWNLLANSVKFSTNGGLVHIMVSCRGREMVIAIQDNGVGIPADFLPRVFDRFQQADSSATREHGGLGLGLALVQEIVTLHGGAVTAASPGPGQGSTFTIVLPALAGGETSLEPAERADPQIQSV